MLLLSQKTNPSSEILFACRIFYVIIYSNLKINTLASKKYLNAVL